MTRQVLLQTISATMRTIWLFIGAILVVFGITFLLTSISQGQDVVVLSGEYFGAGVLMTVGVLFWALLIWYSCRLLSYAKQHKGTNIPSKILQVIPRLLAFNCFVAIQISITGLPSTWSLQFYPLLLLFIAHNVLYFTLESAFTFKNKISGSVSVAIIAGFLFMYYNMLAHQPSGVTDPGRHKFYLPLIGMCLLMLQTASVWFFVYRRNRIDREVAALGYITGHDKFPPYELKSKSIFKWTTLGLACLYCTAIFNMSVADFIGPLGFLLLALGVIVACSNLISYFSIKAGFNLFIFGYILAIVMGKLGDPYQVRLTDPGSADFYRKRPTVNTYFGKWLSDPQRAEILKKCNSKNRYDVYFVISDGGASRAGNWVSSVLSELQDQSTAVDPKNPFGDHIFAISGASGGSVGNSAFYSMLKARSEGKLNESAKFLPHNDVFFSSDFLTYTLGRLLGPDFFRHFLPTHIIMDRGGALEDVVSNGSKDPIINEQMGKNFSQAVDITGRLPVLFITTTRVRDGMPSIISNVQLPEYSQRVDATKYFYKAEDGKDTIRKDIRLVTAAIMSSRFPYVSPAGSINNNYFVDGGYVDNAGSGIMKDLIEELETLKYDTTRKNTVAYQLLKQYDTVLKFHLIHIYNSPFTDRDHSPISPLTNDLFTPVLTLAGMQGSSTKIATGSLRVYFEGFNSDPKDANIEFGLYDTTLKQKEEDYPMSWTISDYHLARMHHRLGNAIKENAGNFWFMKQH